MAPGGSNGVAEAVASWRRDFADPDVIRPDDVAELCDHFRNVVEERLEAGDSLDHAVDTARWRIGEPDRLIEEMERAQRPPRYYRRLCVTLVVYAVAQATLILARVAELSITAYRTRTFLPASASWTYGVSALGVLVGLLVIVVISRRFGLASAGRGMAREGSALGSIVPIVSFGIVVSMGLVFADFWQWWLHAGNPSVSNPWASARWVLAVGTGGPVLALTIATSLREWHPALRRFSSEPILGPVQLILPLNHRRRAGM